MTAASPPDRAQIRQRLSNLLSGGASREETAVWAATWVMQEDPSVDDPVVWEALRELVGADLRVGPDDYLHTEADFHLWLDRVEPD